MVKPMSNLALYLVLTLHDSFTSICNGYLPNSQQEPFNLVMFGEQVRPQFHFATFSAREIVLCNLGLNQYVLKYIVSYCNSLF